MIVKLRHDLPFPITEYEYRLSEVRRNMEKRGIDVMMVSSPENVFYLTGFETTGYTSFQALFIPLEAEPFIVTRILENTGVQNFSWIEQSRPYADGDDPFIRTREALEEFNLQQKQIGYERNAWFFSISQQEKLFAVCSDATFVDCSGLIDGIRVIKSDLELMKIREAARLTEIAIQAGIKAAGAGVRDTFVAAEMHHAMIQAGSDYPADAPYIASGHRSGVGHAKWSGRTLDVGDCVFLEPSGCKQHYHAPCMRTGFIGEPTLVQRDAEKIIKEAVEATIAAIKPGAVAEEVDAVNRNIIGKNTIGLQQLAQSAYPIGMAFPPGWFEGTFSLRPKETQCLQPNMVFHLIPWGLVPGEFAMGLSETIRVTDTGCEVMTKLPREVFVKPPVSTMSV